MRKLYRVTTANHANEYYVICERIEDVRSALASFSSEEIRNIQFLAAEEPPFSDISRLIMAGADTLK